MTRQECIDEISTVIDDMYDNDIASIWNDYCDEVNYGDHRVYCMDELDELLYGMRPTDILSLGANSTIYWSDDWFTFDGYGNIETASHILNVVDSEEVAEYCLDNDECFGYSKIRDILDDYQLELEYSNDEEEEE